ncbi:MAG: hypothetical protein HUJ94_08315 [Bacteroidales bacterium]|nr:hypothetical protein [Bacteroidales bacterium]
MATSISRKTLSLGLADFLAVLFVYMVPTLSHLTSAPLYLLDPMRIAVIGSLIFTRNWKNSLALALTLPLFSYAVGAHPVMVKSLLIAFELSANVLLFAGASKLLKNKGVAMFASIVFSKVLYYVAKFAVISSGLLGTSLVSTQPWIQACVALLLSAGVWLAYRKM